jgi:NitT/TauT family transport system substrate-binding protein
MAIRLLENFRALLYTPFYATEALGHYAAEGVAIERLPALGTEHTARAVVSGRADVGWGGPMRVMQLHDQDPRSPIVCFCEVIGRDPFSLVGRGPWPGFRLANLVGLRLGTVSEVPTPWLCLQEDLRRIGLDPAALQRVADRPMAENLAALERGELEVVQLFEPFVDDAVNRSVARVWHVAAERGPTSYTTFTTTRGTLTAKQTEVFAMVRAMQRTLRWMRSHGAAALADAIAEFFPELPRERLEGALARYLALGIWNADPRVSREGFERLRAGLVSGGFIGRAVPFEECVENGLAERAMRG